MRKVDHLKWKQFKKGRRAFLFVVITYLPGGILIGALAGGVLKPSLWYFFILLFWFIYFIISWNRVYKWQCPQCGEHYFSHPPFMKNAFKRTCAYCGFPKWGKLTFQKDK